MSRTGDPVNGVSDHDQLQQHGRGSLQSGLAAWVIVGGVKQPVRQIKSRTSRWWTTAISGLLKFWGITHFISSLGSCVGGATAIAFCQEMKVLLRALIVIAAIWAILAPAMYGLLFGICFDWSALVDFVIVGSCGVLAFTAFKDISLMLWLAAFLIVTVSATSGFFHHFRDSGESGPLPFEWMNNYFIDAIPLLILSFLSRAFTSMKMQNKTLHPTAGNAPL